MQTEKINSLQHCQNSPELLEKNAQMTADEAVGVPTQLENLSFLPVYASDHAAGADIRACIQEEIHLAPGSSALIPSGLRFAIPEGYEIQIRPRSGLALKNQVTILNTPGTIDADYRGEVGIILINHSAETFIITPGMRIAQMVLSPVVRANFEIVKNLSSTLRGEGGFGHTGTN